MNTKDVNSQARAELFLFEIGRRSRNLRNYRYKKNMYSGEDYMEGGIKTALRYKIISNL